MGASKVSVVDVADKGVTVCGRSGCQVRLYKPLTGRPPKFCSDECRKTAHAWKRQAERAEAERAEHRRRLEEERQQRRRLAGELCSAIASNPAEAATRLVAMLDRAAERGFRSSDSRSMFEENVNHMWRVLTFVTPSSPPRAHDESQLRIEGGDD
jgi:hypothetical protein